MLRSFFSAAKETRCREEEKTEENNLDEKNVTHKFINLFCVFLFVLKCHKFFIFILIAPCHIFLFNDAFNTFFEFLYLFSEIPLLEKNTLGVVARY